MNSSESNAVPRSFFVPGSARRLMLGMFITALLLMAEQVRLSAPYHTPSSSSFSRLMALPLPQQAQPQLRPSAFEEESAMTSHQLLDRWNPLVQQAADKFQVPAEWIRAVMRRESGGRTMLAHDLPIVSPVGAMGLMQVMPSTYGQMARQYRLGSDPFNAHDNVFAAAGYLRWLHRKYGFPAMFAAYNDGPGNYEDHLHGRALPRETRNYLKAIASELGVPVLTNRAPVQFTRPNGSKVTIDAGQVLAVRAVMPGEYAPSVHAVVTMGKTRQGVREDVAVVAQRLRQHGIRV